MLFQGAFGRPFTFEDIMEERIKRFIIGDTETCGLGEDKNACQVGLLEIDPRTLEPIWEIESLIDPQWPISEGAAAMHGITNELVADEPTMDEFVQYRLGGPLKGEITLIAHNCLTGDHEILTRRGWKRFDSLEGDNVEALQWCPETSVLQWHICPVVRQAYTADMFEWDSNYHKGYYTADHRIYQRTPYKITEPWRVITATQMASFGINNQLIPVSGLLEGPGLGLTDSECRVMEMVRADAHVQRKTGFTRLRLSKPRKILRCLELLRKAEMPFAIAECRDGATSISVHNS